MWWGSSSLLAPYPKLVNASSFPLISFFLFFFFCLLAEACAILVLHQRSNPYPLHWELEAQNLNHCTSMEIPPFSSYNVFYIDLIWSVSLLVPYLWGRLSGSVLSI